MPKDIIENPDHFVKFPTAFNTVDIVLFVDNRLLAGRKKSDPDGKYRFPGGFVDPNDSCVEEAAYREFLEETGAHLKNCEKLFDIRIDDSRYVNTPHSVITHVYFAEEFIGYPRPMDDLDELVWININMKFASDRDGDFLIPNHKILWNIVRKYKNLK